MVGPAARPGPHTIIVEEGASLGRLRRRPRRKAGSIPGNCTTYRVMARLFGSHDPIQAGEFEIPKGMGGAAMLDLLQHGKPVQRLITVTEGMPSIIVDEKLAANPLSDRPDAADRRKDRCFPTATAISAAKRARRSSSGCKRR